MLIFLIRNLFLAILGVGLFFKLDFVWFIGLYIEEVNYNKIALVMIVIGIGEPLIYMIRDRFKNFTGTFLYRQILIIDFFIMLGAIAIFVINYLNNDKYGSFFSFILASLAVITLVKRWKVRKEILSKINEDKPTDQHIIE